MRGRALLRFLIVFAVVAGMMLAPVVTWPRSGQSSGAPPPDRIVAVAATSDGVTA